MAKSKNLLLSSHPDDADRIDEIDFPSDGRFARENLNLKGRHKIPGRGYHRPSFLAAQFNLWLRKADVAVVLVTRNTVGCSDIVEDIEIYADDPCGVIGIRLDGSLEPSPDGCCVAQALWNGGFEVVDNGSEETGKALERTHRLTKTMKKIKAR